MGVCRVLNTTALVVAFLLPPLSVDVCMHAKCHALGGLLTSGVGRRRPPTSRSGRNGGLRRVLNCYAFLRNEKLSSTGGGCCVGFLAIRGPGGVLDTFSPRGRRVERGKLRGISGFRVLREGGANALVTHTEGVVHEMDMFYMVIVLFGPFVYDYKTERLFLCCVVQSRFDPFEVCPGVGTVVTVVVACARYGVPCYGTGLLAVSVLVPYGNRSGKAPASHVAFRSQCRATSLSQVLCVFKNPAEQSWEKLSSAGGGCCTGFLVIRGPGGVLDAFSPRGCRVERGKHRGISGGASALVTLMERVVHEMDMFDMVIVLLQCGTVEVCVIFLDTLTPVFELYVRLRERRQ
ncbi:hypothetical protein Taro_003903 [Colocasia esculenta]|uniref:Uncharacterized protein n=1 Tax=Colocasia esculenta TaxID=4460 RepID=A0A843TGU7_COLES|nr:hypothetical protein [Colocasia esculenta]